MPFPLITVDRNLDPQRPQKPHGLPLDILGEKAIEEIKSHVATQILLNRCCVEAECLNWTISSS